MYNKRAFQKQCNHHKADKCRHHGEHPFKRALKEKFRAKFNTPPANVRELEDKYELHLIAPGYEKKDFAISLKDQVLSISVEDKEEEQDTWKRREYIPKGFVRQFELNEKIDTTAIAAKYENGILIVSLPKLEGFETEHHKISIA